jgi:hypothetical protein
MIISTHGILANSVPLNSLNTGLFGVYNGDNNANDSFGTNNGTAVGGLTYTTGKINNAFQFNGTNAQVNLANNSLNSLADTFSVSCWVYFNTISGGQCVLSNFNTSGGVYGFTIFLSASQGLALSRFNGSTEDYLNIGAIGTGQWYHCVVTRKPNATKVYLNTTSASNTSSLTTAYNSSCNVSIGTRPDGVWRFGNGALIDALTIWNKELTATEVLNLYNSGNGKQYPY